MSVEGQPSDDIVVDEGADEGGDWDATADDDPAGDEMDDGVFDWFIPSGAPYAFPGSSNDTGAAAGLPGAAAAPGPPGAAAGAAGTPGTAAGTPGTAATGAAGTPGTAAGTPGTAATGAAGSPGTAAAGAAGTPGTAPAGGADGPGGATPAGDNIDLTSLIAHLTNESDESALIDEVRMVLDEMKASQQMAMQKIETVTRIVAQSILEGRQVQAMVRDLQTLLIRVIQDRPAAGAGHPPPGQPLAPTVHDISEL